MTEERLAHLLACLTEECGETTQVVGKCLRFGINDYHPKTDNVPNFELLRREFNDIVAVAEMLGIMPDRKLINSKKARVETYIEYAEAALGKSINGGGNG